MYRMHSILQKTPQQEIMQQVFNIQQFPCCVNLQNEFQWVFLRAIATFNAGHLKVTAVTCTVMFMCRKPSHQDKLSLG